MSFQFSYIANKSDNRAHTLTASYSDLVELLSTSKALSCGVQCIGKNCIEKTRVEAWCPFTFDRVRSSLKALHTSFLILDVDDCGQEALEGNSERLEGYKYLCHSTHTNKPGNYRYRVVLFLSRVVSGLEWVKFWPLALEFLDLSAIDKSTKDTARLLFLPSHPTGTTPFFCENDGDLLDVDLILSSPVQQNKPVTKQDTLQPSFDGSSVESIRNYVSISIKGFSQRNSEKSRASATLLKRVLDQEPLCTTYRDNTVHELMSTLAFCIPRNALSSAVLEVVRPSINLMSCEPEGALYWLEKAKKSFERAQEKAIIFDQEKEVKRNEDLTAQGVTGEWVKDLILNEKGLFKTCGFNIGVLLRNHEDTKGFFRFNEVLKTIEVHGGYFEKLNPQVLHIAVSNWLASKHGIFAFSQDIKDQIALISRENSYDPLADRLQSLVWDQKQRLKSVFVDYFGAYYESKEDLERLKMVGMFWFVMLVSRAMIPGAICQYMLILQGAQGAKKSAILEALCEPYYSDAIVKLSNAQNTTLLCARSWLLELPELAAFEGTSEAVKKNFITLRTDSMRPPYGSVIEDFNRRCVFVGTVNPEQFLNDPTGNRRYWVVNVRGTLDTDKMTRDRDQLLAEAVHLFKSGFQYYPDERQSVILADHAKEFVEDTPIKEQIFFWFSNQEPYKRPLFISLLEIYNNVLFLSGEIQKKTQTLIGVALRQLGFEKKPNYKNGIYQLTLYKTPQFILELPKKGNNSETKERN